MSAVIRPPARPRSVTHAQDCSEAQTLTGAFRVYLGFGSPRILLSSAVLLLSLRLWVGAWSGYDAIIALAVLVYWPFQEWFMHMFVLHIKPRQVGPLKIDPYFARVHRWHHQHPRVIERIFVPWEVILGLSVLHAALWLWLAPLSLALSGLLFVTVAAVIYEWVHFLVHMPYRPRTRYFQRVRRNHYLHHFKNEHFWHAFTGPWIDSMMGTAPDPGSTEQSPTVRNLGVDDGFEDDI